MVEICKRKRNS